jgi:hypothetical protein
LKRELTLFLGEYQIAQAFSITLVNGFSIGVNPISIPASLPVRPISIPTNIIAASSVEGITVTWDKVYGAMGYDIQYQIVGTGTWNTWSTTSNRYDTSEVLDGWVVEFMIRTSNGDTVKSDVRRPNLFLFYYYSIELCLYFSHACGLPFAASGYQIPFDILWRGILTQITQWSGIISAVCHPQTPGPPSGVQTSATATGVDISWEALDDIIEYAVWVYDRDTVGAFVDILGIEPTRLSAHVDSLTPGIHYIIAVQAWK